MAPQYKQNLKGLVKVSKSQYSSIVYISVVYMQRENCRNIKIKMVKLLATQYVTEKF